jgi:hypothetical protein
MMPMQMRRKARKIEKVENSPALQPRGISCQHAGTNQITPARFGGRIFSQPMPPCSSATRVAQALIGAAIAIDWSSETAIQPAIAALPDMSHFAAEFYEYCANPAAPL